jgi:hypothetical protein
MSIMNTTSYHHQHGDNDGNVFFLFLSAHVFRFAQGEAANIEQICDEMMGQRVGSLSLRFACVVMKGAIESMWFRLGSESGSSPCVASMNIQQKMRNQDESVQFVLGIGPPRISSWAPSAILSQPWHSTASAPDFGMISAGQGS